MKFFKIFPVLLILLLFQTVKGQNVDVKSEDCVSGKIRIKLKQEQLQNINSQLKSLTTTSQTSVLGIKKIDVVSEEVGILRIRRVFPFSIKHENKQRKYGLHLWYELDFDESIDPLTVVDKYKGLTELEIVKPVYKKVRIDSDKKVVPYTVEVLSKGSATLKSSSSTQYEAFFNDPMLPDQWHYENDGRVGTDSLDTDLFAAWAQTTGNSDIIVAIVDQGVDVFHEDLAANIWRNESEIDGIEGVDDDGNGYIDDYYGYNFTATEATVPDGSIRPGDHGTHVAGTVGAVSNNGIGVAGVAGGDGSGNGVKMMSCQVFDDRVIGGVNFAAAIVYGANNGAVISQNSWGYNLAGYYEPEVHAAIQYFVENAGTDGNGNQTGPMKGGILFFAAGNTGDDILRYPGAFEEVIGVTSISANGFPSPYSSFGDWADIGALGGDQTNFGTEGGVLSTITDNNYGYMEGTSMACPHVSGVAALVLSKFSRDGFTADSLKLKILNSTDRFIFQHNSKYGTGLLNATSALIDDNREPPLPITDLRAGSIFHNEVRLEWTVPVDNESGEPRYYYLAIGTSEITAANFENQGLFLLQNELKAGETFKINVGGFQKQTKYWFALKSADQFDNLSEISNILPVTTSNLPHFMESTRSISVDVDVTQEAIQRVPIQLSNIGDGIVYYNSIVNNEEYYWEQDEVQQALVQSLNAKAEEAEVNSALFETTRSFTKAIPGLKSSPAVPEGLKHWENDRTEFVAGIGYHDYNYGADFLMGSGNTNAGLIFATRFDIPYDYSFNLTHIQAVFLPEINDKPIVVEIKKGSKWVQEAETVYLQEYYPDTTNVFGYYTIPLYRPQRFTDNEIFWVVLHFPKEMEYPLAVQLSDYREGYFIMSRDNGNRYEEAYNYLYRSVAPMLSALSSGNDGAFVFLDPVEGEIAKDQTVTAEVIVDATNLSEGKHLASLGITTNDIHKPTVNIEVKVNVTGQKPEVDTDKVYQFKSYAFEENELSFELKNTGLKDFIVYDVTSVSPGFSKNFTDSVVISPEFTRFVPFAYTPPVTGFIETQVTLVTNVGDVPLSCTFENVEAPVLNFTGNNVVNVAYGDQASLDIQLSNTGSSTVLEYDLSHYSRLNISKGKIPEKLSYQVLRSSDVNGPVDGAWDDIEEFSNPLNYEAITGHRFELNMGFPFYSEIMTNAWMNQRGQLFFYSDGLLSNDPDAEFYGAAKGLFVPVVIKDHYLRIDKVYNYSFGDRSIFTVYASVFSLNSTNIPVGTISYQIVLLRDGSMEYRYQNVDVITPEMNYTVAIQGLVKDDIILLKDYDDTNNQLYNGQVVRIEPLTDLSMIVEATPLKGIINAGESKTVTLTIDPATYSRMQNSYQNNVLVKTNTAAKQELYPFTINVTGTPAYKAIDTVDFGSARIGFDKQAFVSVYNTGSAPGELTSVVFNNDQFTVANTLPLTINSSSQWPLKVVYTPATATAVEAKAILTFTDGTTFEVLLMANGEVDPGYSTNLPASITQSINGGAVVKVPFSITGNATGVPLEVAVKSNWLAMAQTSTKKRGEEVATTQQLNDYGYWWAVSGDAYPMHRWEDIGDDAQVLQIEQDKQQEVELPFEFPFYGGLYNKLWVSKNGYVTVVKPTSDYFDLEFTKDDGLRGMIMPFGSTMITREKDGGVKMKADANRLVLQWDNFLPESNPGAVTFQLEMLADGTVYFHYKDVETWGFTLNYGLESPDESEVLEHYKTWIVDWAHFTNNSSIMILPPHKQVVASGQKADYELVLSARDVYKSGIYRDTVEVHTNSVAQPLLKVAVELNVSGNGILKMASTIDWGEVIYKPGLVLKYPVTVANVGYETLSLTQVSGTQLPAITLYDADGNKIVRNSAGVFLSPVKVDPWDETVITVEIPVTSKEDIAGALKWAGSFEEKTVPLTAKLVDSPVFAWTATDQSFSMVNTDVTSYTFILSNEGTTTMKYSLAPAVVPTGGGNEYPGVIEGDGHYTTEYPFVVDSMHLDKKDAADAYNDPFTEPSSLGYANKFVAPVGGFFLTHIKVNTNLSNIDEYATIKIFAGGDDPSFGTPFNGELLYEEKYLIDQVVDKEWVFFPLRQPITIAEGTVFYVVVAQPGSENGAQLFMGYENQSDVNVYKNSFSGAYWQDGKYKWECHEDLYYANYIWKIRPLTAAGDDSFVELDTYNGEIAGGESIDVTATISAAKAGKGTHNALMVASTNDINHLKNTFNITVNVNGAPEFRYRPNNYKDTLKITETESLLLNYLFEDPEDEVMTFMLENVEDGPTLKYRQTGNTTAQIDLKTDYNDAGEYHYPVKVKDASGSLSLDTVVIKVLDKNRAPVLNQDYAIITLNIADPRAFTINPADLFTDPDDDDLQILAGNYTPEIVDMSLGSAYINLNPLMVGTGMIVFGADDGKEDGFVVYGVYVQVIDDEDAVNASPDGNGGQTDIDLNENQNLLVYPNPVVDGNCNIIYKVEEEAEVVIEIYNSTGIKVEMISEKKSSAGEYSKNINLDRYGSGIYYCRYLVSGELVDTKKIVVK